ncbi:CHAD domain-containing protein, partial [Kocuria sp. p3-SID1433]|uniref:CHAD domain-containing protein n=1 Tax=unclassified Kocuria TaxID=2649579 RepID=UPI0021A635CD|nr:MULTISPECIES: CHAD domain-containing protein [unclassified Kocuria]MCT1600852.1 CHAD domain-containing protein [Kocuria sp. p3-SID1428]MCT2180048.1 CHAD domain-containing protein [Kocuria sp. p3-SID1433]
MSDAESSAQHSVRLSPQASAQIQKLPLSSPASGEDMVGAVFHDTQDRALRRRGLTLSRSAEPERGWLLSIPEGDDHWAVEVPRLRSAPQRLPAALTQVVSGIVGQAELVEIDDDADQAPDADDSAKAAKKAKKAGEPTGVDVLQAVLAQQTAALEMWDLKARLDLPDALHQLRVTARSLRGLLKSARPFLDRESVDELGERLQQLGRSLSQARDAEVVAELLPQRAAELQGRVSEKTAQALAQAAQKHSETSAAKVRGGAQSERTATLQLARAIAQEPPFTDKGRKKAAGLTPRQMSDQLVRRALRKATKETDRALAAARDEELDAAQRLEHLHTVRKATKRVRYVAKVLRAAGFRPSKPVRKLGKAAQKAQDALGKTMDTALTTAWLQGGAAGMRRAGADPYELGLLTGVELQRLAHGIDAGDEIVARLARRLEQHS